MKNSKLFIPFGTFAACCSIATPLMVATSCSNANVRNFDFVAQQFDYKGGKTSLTDAQTRAGATTEYVAAIKNNPELFVQDYVNYLYTMDGGVQQSPDNWKQYKISITLPTIGSTTVEYPGEGTETYATISFKIAVDSIYETEVSGVTINRQDTGVIEYKNIPFFAYPDPDTGEWRIGIRQVLGINSGDNSFGSSSLNYSYIMQYMTDSFGINGTYDRTITYTFDTVEGYKDIQKVHNDIAVNNWKDVQTLQNSGSNSLTSTFMDFKSRYFEKLDSSYEIVSYDDEIQGEISVSDTKNLVTITGLQLSRSAWDSYNERSALPTMTVAEDYDLPIAIGGESFEGTYVLHIGKGAILDYQYSSDTYRKMMELHNDSNYARSLVIKSGANNESRVCIENVNHTTAANLPKTANTIWNAKLPKRIKFVEKLEEGESEPFSVATNDTSLSGYQVGSITEPTVKAISCNLEQFIKGYGKETGTYWTLQYDADVDNLYINNLLSCPDPEYPTDGRYKGGYVFVDVTAPDATIIKGIVQCSVSYLSQGNLGIYLYPNIFYRDNYAKTGELVEIDLSKKTGKWKIEFSQTGTMTTDYLWIRDSYINNHSFKIPTSGLTMEVVNQE